jgi:Zn-finger nucleic acid-binding protein
MKCPKDGAEMDKIKVENTRIDICQKCSGIWMDWGELSELSDQKVTEHELIFRGDSKRLCPRCGKQMRKADLHSVIVEECKCGIYFDSGEAEKVIGGAGKKIEFKSKAIMITRHQLDELLKTGTVNAGGAEIKVVD